MCLRPIADKGKVLYASSAMGFDTGVALGISKMSFPQQINIGRHQYQLIDEKSVEE